MQTNEIYEALKVLSDYEYGKEVTDNDVWLSTVEEASRVVEK